MALNQGPFENDYLLVHTPNKRQTGTSNFNTHSKRFTPS